MLTALADRAHFIVYKVVPVEDSPKADKIPIDPLTGFNSNAQNPATWMTPAVAERWAAEWEKVKQGPVISYGVGIVLYDGCGLLCVDIDAALQPNDTWSEIATYLCTVFQGAAVEVSQSGRGLHIFAYYTGVAPEHSSKNNQLHIEYYTSGRFIALTGDRLQGSISFDATNLLPWLTSTYFPPGVAGNFEGWTHEAVDTYRGPYDDAELIKLALATKSAAAIFGDGATFADLWYAREEALVRAFPPNPNGKDSYDASDADASLASRLAWWTGSNCDRILSLMQLSQLVRPKWDRDDYLQRTILKGCGWTKDHYLSRAAANSAPVPAPSQQHVEQAPAQFPPAVEGYHGLNGHTPAPPATPDTVPEGYVARPGEVFNIAMMQQKFKGFIYVTDINAVFIPPPYAGTLTKERFDIVYGGNEFAMTIDGQKPTDSAWEAFTVNQAYRFPKVDGMYFEPREEPGRVMVKNHRQVVNSWMPVEIPMTPGDPAPFVNHVHKVFSAGEDAMILIYYMAAVMQYKGIKSKWAPLIQGVEGNGKTLLSAIMKKSLGARYAHDAKASQIDSKFNASFYGKLLVVVEEIQISEDKGSVWESLKTMITEETLEIEAKGVDKVTREVCFNFIFNSNHKDAIRKGANDRRVAPFFAAQQSVQDLIRDGMLDADGNSKYFDALFEWLDAGGYAIVAHYLNTLAIPDKYNFAKRCRRAPRTSSTEMAIEVSLGSAEQEIVEAATSGATGFANGWVSSIELDRLLERIGKSRFFSRSKRRDMLYSLGYILHPGLPDGRVTQMIDGQRPRLYVKRGHLTLPLKGADVQAAYLAAQKRQT